MGPSWTAAAPMASEVGSGCRPCTRRVTLQALADVDAKVPHDRTLHRDVFLVLGHDARLGQTVRTPRGQPRLGRLVDARGQAPMRPPAVGRATLATGALRQEMRINRS